jgi:hypothetical protein
VDAIADTVGGDVAAKLIAKVKQSGSFGYTAVLPESAAAQNPTVKITRVLAQPDPSKVREFADDVRDGKFVLPIGRRMPLRDAAEAHVLGEKGGIGKILLGVRGTERTSLRMRFLVQHPGQFPGSDPEHHTDGNGRGAGGAELVGSGHALLTEKVSRSEQRNRGFFAVFGNNREFSPARPKIKQTVGAVSLRRKDLFSLERMIFLPGPAVARYVSVLKISRVFGHTQELHVHSLPYLFTSSHFHFLHFTCCQALHPPQNALTRCNHSANKLLQVCRIIPSIGASSNYEHHHNTHRNLPFIETRFRCRLRFELRQRPRDRCHGKAKNN